MRRKVFAMLPVLLAAAATVQAHGRVRVHVGLGWGWWYPWWWEPVVVRPVLVEARTPDLAVVDTDVSPEHARVLLDGQLIGTADDFDGHPDFLYLKPGRYTLEFVLTGYETQRIEVEARPGRYFPIALELARKAGERPAPWYDRPEGLPVARVFGKERPKAVEPARPDPSLRPELRSRPRPAERSGRAALRFAVEPPQAAVYLDGEFLGTAEELSQLARPLAVEPGEHVVEVMAPGYASERLSLRVGEGEVFEVRLELSGGAGQSPPRDL